MKRHVTCFVEKAGFEPRSLGTKAERYNHCATRLVRVLHDFKTAYETNGLERLLNQLGSIFKPEATVESPGDDSLQTAMMAQARI